MEVLVSTDGVSDLIAYFSLLVHSFIYLLPSVRTPLRLVLKHLKSLVV